MQYNFRVLLRIGNPVGPVVADITGGDPPEPTAVAATFSRQANRWRKR
jgi:hypothetical protein